MADPIVTDHFRVLAVFERSTGIPADRVVNSWCFRNDAVVGGIAAFAGNVRAVLDDFYSAVQGYLSDGLDSLEYRVYDLGESPPRTPYIEPSVGFTGGTASAMPGEVALCVSARTADRTARGRGRIYLGPLGSSTYTASNGVARPGFVVRQAIAGAAQGILDAEESVTWCVLSQADAAAKVVTGGYVDDAFDTIRSRGVEATTREAFGDYVSPSA